jgi:4a-hydroxytetrahydrobiopterin dehydratase
MRGGECVAPWRMAGLLDEAGIGSALATVPRWRREGAEIVREVKFNTYMDGVSFVGRVAQLAEESRHHPDIHIGWRKVTLRLSTHSKGGLTELDFDLARMIERLVA